LIAYAGSSSPTGWLLCDGSPQLKASYPDLWALIGSTYGTATLTQFYLPDLRGRIPVGLDNMGGTDAARLSVANTLGDAGGVQTVTLDSTQVPNHGHGATVTDPQHSHPTVINIQHGDGTVVNAPTEALITGLQQGGRRRYTDVTNNASTGISVAVAATTGGGGSHNNMQPYILTNYIIKT
jgi:microcystin-dependent protein